MKILSLKSENVKRISADGDVAVVIEDGRVAHAA
jgi:hypothetical protein